MKNKPTRTEIVQVRLTPKVKYLTELGARKNRQTISTFIQWAITQEINNEETTVLIDELWDDDEWKRLEKLAKHFPALLTFEEEILLRERKEW